MKSNVIWGIGFIILALVLALLAYGIIPIQSIDPLLKLIPISLLIIIGVFLIFSKSESIIEGEKK